jgi:adenylate kinase
VRIVLLGMPGVGKGTQASMLCQVLGVAHVSTGDILRQAVASGSALGRQAKSHMEAGGLVPDPLVEELVVERLGRADARPGFVLDGFPRSLEQVAMLDRILGRLGHALDRVVFLVAQPGEIVRRLAGRRVCPRCDRVYHVDHQPPRSPGVCDQCGSALVQRADDGEAVVRERLEVFARQTLPIVEGYRSRGLLREVDGTGEPPDVAARVLAAVGRA